MTGMREQSPNEIPPADQTTPGTRALQALIDASVEQLMASDTRQSDGLLFLGSWQESIPRLLVIDPVLGAGEVRLWMYLKISARAGSGASFPSYQAIREALHVSEPTIATQLAVLRITRWVTLCRRVRDPSGRVRGNVYALHEEPLPLADALYLDPEYMQYLKASAESHRDRRVRNIAEGLLDSLAGQIAEGRDILDDSTLGQAGRRAEAMAYFTAGVRPTADRRFFGFSPETVEQINRPGETTAQEAAEIADPEPLVAPHSLGAKLDRLKKLKTAGTDLRNLSEPVSTDLKNLSEPVPADLRNLSESKREQKVQNGPFPADLKTLSKPICADLKILSPPESGSSGCSCSFFINKKTTTTTTTETEENSAHARETLELPADLGANEQAMLGLHLEAVPEEHRQALVDEWDARRRAGLNRNDLSWLAWAAHQIRDGNLTVLTSFALNAERRRRRERVLRAQDRRAIAALSQANAPQAGDETRHADRAQNAIQTGTDPQEPINNHRHKGDKP